MALAEVPFDLVEVKLAAPSVRPGTVAKADALGGSGFIAAFVAGMTFRLALGRDPEQINELSDQVGNVLNGVTFVLFGAILLGPALGGLSWKLALYALLSLTIVRMLPVAISMLGTRARLPTLGFLGWFGPRGLASIVFAVIVVEESNLPRAPDRSRHLSDRRTLGVRPWPHRGATRRPLRELVRAAPAPHSAAARERTDRGDATQRTSRAAQPGGAVRHRSSGRISVRLHFASSTGSKQEPIKPMTYCIADGQGRRRDRASG